MWVENWQSKYIFVPVDRKILNSLYVWVFEHIN